MDLTKLGHKIEKYLRDAEFDVKTVAEPDHDGGAWMCRDTDSQVDFFISVESNEDDLQIPTVTIGAIIETFDPNDPEEALDLETALGYLDLAGSLIGASITITRFGLDGLPFAAVVNRVPIEQFELEMIEDLLNFNLSQIAALTGITEGDAPPLTEDGE
ncbi:MAG TPA: hypothetical protein PKW95_08365 [bacterium]|nr:hypothetical protein [bacterium]